MIFKAPYQVPTAKRVTVVRGFGPTNERLDPGGPNGEPHFHYGVDIVFGTDRETYGVPLALPFPEAKLISYVAPGDPGGANSHATYRYRSTSGNVFDMVLVHVSEIVFQYPLRFGAVVAYVGNVGTVWPQPDIKNPWDGAHLHLGLKVNGKWEDPMRWFDIFDPFIGEADDAQKDVPALSWALRKAMALYKQLVGKK